MSVFSKLALISSIKFISYELFIVSSFSKYSCSTGPSLTSSTADITFLLFIVFLNNNLFINICLFSFNKAPSDSFK